MKIEKINCNKIKVTLTPTDLDGLNIAPTEISPESPELRRLVVLIIRKAEAEADFSTLGADIQVEAIAQQENFIFLISKVFAEKNTPPKVKARIKKVAKSIAVLNAAKPVAKPKKDTGSAPETFPENAIYVFENFDMFLAMLSAVNNTDALYDSKLYKADDNYYLEIPHGCKNAFMLSVLANEFANRQTDFTSQQYLSEYGKIVATKDDFYRIENCFSVR